MKTAIRTICAPRDGPEISFTLVIMAASKRKELTLEQKIALPKDSERLSQRKLSATYGVSKTTVSNVLKRKAEYLEAYECNDSPSKKRICFREDSHVEVDKTVYEWFQQKRAQNIPLSGPLIQEKALETANSLGISDFKASNSRIYGS